MPQPDKAQYIDNINQDVAQAYFQTQSNFIASQVFPPVVVDKESAKYYVFTKNDFLRSDMQIRANASESAGSGFSVSNTNYEIDVFAEHKDVTERDRKNWNLNSIPIDEATTQLLVQHALQKMERQWATDFFTTGLWGTTNTLTGTDQWSAYSTSDPISVVDTGITTVLSNTGFKPNVGVVGFQTWQKLKRHPLVVDRVSGGATTANPANATTANVAAIFELEKLYVCQAVKATNIEGETAAYDFIEGKHMLLCYVPSNPSLVTPSAGYTFLFDGAGSGTTISTYRIPMPQLGIGTERLEIEMGWDNKITGSDLGYMILNAVA